MRILEGSALETVDRLALGALELEEGSEERRRVARLFHVPCVLTMITTLMVQKVTGQEMAAVLQLVADLTLLWTSTGVIDEVITTTPEEEEDQLVPRRSWSPAAKFDLPRRRNDIFPVNTYGSE